MTKIVESATTIKICIIFEHVVATGDGQGKLVCAYILGRFY